MTLDVVKPGDFSAGAEHASLTRARKCRRVQLLRSTYLRGSGVGEKTALQPANKTGYPMLEQLKHSGFFFWAIFTWTCCGVKASCERHAPTSKGLISSTRRVNWCLIDNWSSGATWKLFQGVCLKSAFRVEAEPLAGPLKHCHWTLLQISCHTLQMRLPFPMCPGTSRRGDARRRSLVFISVLNL